ncbi:MAG: LytTR family DNA-binding domain-containing protein [Gemmatimonadaceae bacterium]
MSIPRYGVLLIDDEPLARQRLRQLLHSAPDFEVVGECADARQVAEVVRELRPAVVFLDVRMPHMDGFAAQAVIGSLVRHVVFVTAHAEHAARAFDVAASDYLVKPVTQARFNGALDRMRLSLGESGVERVLLGSRLGGAAVELSDVSCVEADGAYVVVHAAGRRHVLRESMSGILARLGAGAGHFVRIHRSAGINLAHVQALRRGKRQGLEVELTNGMRLPISRRKAREVVELLRHQPRAAVRNTG